MRRNFFSRILLVIFALLSQCCLIVSSVQAQTAEGGEGGDPQGITAYEEGVHYTVLESPVAPPSPFVIVFSYFGSETLRLITPALIQWSKDTEIPMTVAPAHSEESQVTSARLHHTLSQMGELGRLYESAFELFQTQDSELYGEERINAFLAIWELDQEEFWETWESEGVLQLLGSSLQLTQMVGVTNTPAFLVQGRFLVDTTLIEDGEALLSLLEYLAYKDLPENQ